MRARCPNHDCRAPLLNEYDCPDEDMVVLFMDKRTVAGYECLTCGSRWDQEDEE